MQGLNGFVVPGDEAPPGGLVPGAGFLKKSPGLGGAERGKPGGVHSAELCLSLHENPLPCGRIFPPGRGFYTFIRFLPLPEDGGVDGQLLTGADQVHVLDVVPGGDLLQQNTVREQKRIFAEKAGLRYELHRDYSFGSPINTVVCRVPGHSFGRGMNIVTLVPPASRGAISSVPPHMVFSRWRILSRAMCGPLSSVGA